MQYILERNVVLLGKSIYTSRAHVMSSSLKILVRIIADVSETENEKWVLWSCRTTPSAKAGTPEDICTNKSGEQAHTDFLDWHGSRSSTSEEGEADKSGRGRGISMEWRVEE